MASAINLFRQAFAAAGTALHSVNPSLLSHPPPYFEETGFDVCYKGPKGESDGDAVVLCQSLLGGESVRRKVASWYIHPERHIIETLLYLAISIILIKRASASNQHFRLTTPSEQSIEPPLQMKLTTSVVVALHIGYKMDKWFYMTAPCNLCWIAYWTICYMPMSPRAMQIFYQLMIPFLAFPTLAFVLPEQDRLTHWMEMPFFYIHHLLLVIYAMYLLRSGRASMLAEGARGARSVLSSLLHQWMMAVGVFGVYMSGIIVPLSIYFGLNLNYVMSPPPQHELFSGPWYRHFLVGYFAIKFLICQVIVLMFELYREQRVQLGTKQKGE